MLNRQNNRPRSFPLCWIAMLFGFLLSCASTAAAEVVGEWRSFGGVALGCDGPVRDMAASPDGTVYLGGSFGLCGNVVVNNVVAFDPVSGEFSALGIEEANGVDGEVHAVLVHDGSLYVTGVFARAGAVAQAGGIARWDGDVWTGLGSGLSNSGQLIYGLTLVVHGGEVVVGGRFTHAGGESANNIARWDGAGWQALGVDGSNGVNGQVNKLASDGARLYAGGYFSTAGGVPATRLAAWDGSFWDTLQNGVSWGGIPPQIDALAVHGGDLYVGGLFTSAGGVSTTGIARWDGYEWHAIGTPSHVWGINDISAGADGVVVTGVFSHAGGIEANGLARWDGMQWHAMGTGLRQGSSGYGFKLLRHGDDLYVAGGFTFVDGVPAVNLARLRNGEWQPATVASAHGLYSRFRNNGPHWPMAMVSFGGSLYAGGRITLAGDRVVNDIARWDGHQWNPLNGPSGSGVNGDVLDLLAWDDALWLVGEFTHAGGLESPLIARWSGSEWLPFQPDLELGGGFGSVVRSLATDGQNLFVAGRFTSIGGVPANSVARWDGQAWHPMGNGLGLDGEANDLVLHEGELFLAGRLTNNWGDPAVVMRWDGAEWQETESQFWTHPGGSHPTSVNALASTGSGLFAIGRFDGAGSDTTRNIARRTASGWGALALGEFGFGSDLTAISAFKDGVVLALRDSDDSGADTFLLYREFDVFEPLTHWLTLGWAGGGFELPSSSNRGGVTALASHQGRVFAGGGFSILRKISGLEPSFGFAAFEPDLLFSDAFEGQ